MPAQLTSIVVKPPRLNFAGYCLWCGEQRCQRARCISLHLASVWQVCIDCDGTMDGLDGMRCESCFGGVIEAAKSGTPDDSVPLVVDTPAACMPCPFFNLDSPELVAVCAEPGTLGARFAAPAGRAASIAVVEVLA